MKSYLWGRSQQSGSTRVIDSYLRSPALACGASVDVQGLTGNVTSATLRIYANSASSTGYAASSVSRA